MRDLNELMGTYKPGYFEIYVNTDDEIDLNTLSEDRLSTFFHEWIHFLQDFTTSVGCNNSYSRIEFLKAAGVRCMKQPEPVSLPVDVGTEKNVLANKFIRVKEWGFKPKTPVFSSVTDSRIEDVKIPDGWVSNSDLKEIPICKAKSDLGEDFGFGTAAIMESMAFECQKLVFPPSGPDGHKTYPYHVARLVAESIVPGFCDDPLRLIALCDMSLMVSAPGPQFVSYLKEVSKGSIPYSQNPEEIYDWFYRPQKDRPTIMDGYKEINALAKNSFLGILKDTEAFKDYHAWINNAYDKALELRINSRYFLLELLRKGDLRKNDDFSGLLSLFGTSLLRNNHYDYTKIPFGGNSGWDVEYLQASWEVNDFLTASDYRGCSLKNWCLNSDLKSKKEGRPADELINPDRRCDVNPSERSYDTKLCPFALVWYAMGLPDASR